MDPIWAEGAEYPGEYASVRSAVTGWRGLLLFPVTRFTVPGVKRRWYRDDVCLTGSYNKMVHIPVRIK